MATWANICQLVKYADFSSELSYQKSIIVMVLETGLGWQSEQISEQKSLTLGSINRLVPDIVLKKDDYNTFIVEMKDASHIKRECDVAQLTSYMKQIETPIGVYIGKEIEVYFSWCLVEEDIITLADRTRIAVSNQWGFNNTSKPRMDRLREIASQFDIDVSLPF